MAFAKVCCADTVHARLRALCLEDFLIETIPPWGGKRTGMPGILLGCCPRCTSTVAIEVAEDQEAA